METSSRGTHTEAGEAPHAALLLQTHKSTLLCCSLFMKVLLTGVLTGGSEWGLLTQTLQLAALLSALTDTPPTRYGAVFLAVPTSFDFVQVKLRFTKLPSLNPRLTADSFFTSIMPNVTNVLELSHFYTSQCAVSRRPGWPRAPCAVQCVCACAQRPATCS
jgi:hypothetical protein